MIRFVLDLITYTAFLCVLLAIYIVAPGIQ